MTLRRYAPLKPSRGTVWPAKVRRNVRLRDKNCVGWQAGFPVVCRGGPTELHHVRASHGISMKSASIEDNGVLLDPWCHRWATEHGKEARPLLLAYLARFYPAAV